MMEKNLKDITYSSGIFDTDNKLSRLSATFTLEKKFNCFTEKNLNLMVDKLERLKNENFNRIHIPDFKYRIEGNVITYNTTFIKGWSVGTLIPKFSNIVYEDIVQRESDWTFDDYGSTNFIVESNTDKIFAVDFQSYNYIPDRDYRESKWKKFQNFHSCMLSDMMRGEWINPPLHPLREI